MTLWRPFKTQTLNTNRVRIDQGVLTYQRSNGALTRIDIDHLLRAEIRTIKDDVYWLLTDQSQRFALINEREPGMADVRRYLSTWRGFDYDGLCRYDAERMNALQLWPLETRQRAAA